MNNLDFVLAKNGLVKLANVGGFKKNANPLGAVVKSLLPAAGAFLKYKPQQVLTGARNLLTRLPGVNLSPVATTVKQLQNAAKWETAAGRTADAWNKVNPLVRGAIKYPTQIGLGYGLGIPVGAAGWGGFMAGNAVDQAKAKGEGAALALEGVKNQLAQAQEAYNQAGLLGRLGGGFTAAFSPEKIFTPIDSELTAQIKRLRGK